MRAITQRSQTTCLPLINGETSPLGDPYVKDVMAHILTKMRVNDEQVLAIGGWTNGTHEENGCMSYHCHTVELVLTSREVRRATIKVPEGWSRNDPRRDASAEGTATNEIVIVCHPEVNGYLRKGRL